MARITEDYISFETAKLLIKKGFDYNSEYDSYYTFGGIIVYFADRPQDLNIAPRVTLQMAMKWLRKEHNIHIQIWILEEKGYWFDVEKILNAQYKHKSLYSTGLEDIYFESYEEACESAIKYSLENLI